MVVRSSAPSVSEEHRPYLHEYLIAEDEMGDSVAQTVLLAYLERGADPSLSGRGLVRGPQPDLLSSGDPEQPEPDLPRYRGLCRSGAGCARNKRVTSWEMRPEQARAQGHPVRPSPTVVLEVASKSTWETDIAEGEKNKPWLYGRMGAREYFAYDPNNPPVWREGRGARGAGTAAAGVALRRGRRAEAAGAGRAGLAVERDAGQLAVSRWKVVAPLRSQGARRLTADEACRRAGRERTSCSPGGRSSASGRSATPPGGGTAPAGG